MKNDIETRICHTCHTEWTGHTDPATVTLPLPIDVDPETGQLVCDDCYTS